MLIKAVSGPLRQSGEGPVPWALTLGGLMYEGTQCPQNSLRNVSCQIAWLVRKGVAEETAPTQGLLFQVPGKRNEYQEQNQAALCPADSGW